MGEHSCQRSFVIQMRQHSAGEVDPPIGESHCIGQRTVEDRQIIGSCRQTIMTSKPLDHAADIPGKRCIFIDTTIGLKNTLMSADRSALDTASGR